MVAERMIRIVLLDDHPAILLGLRSLFSTQEDMEVIASLSRAVDLTRLSSEPAPDLFIVDLRMPEMGGVQAVRVLNRMFPSAKTLILTSFNLDEEIFRALEAGAHGCMLKNIDPDEMLNAIRRVHAGGAYISSDIAKRLEERSSRSALSLREIEILSRVAQGNSNKEIGTQLLLSEFTVRNHLIRILDKLNAHDRTEAVTIAIRAGLLKIDP